MHRRLLTAILLAATAFNAAAQRIALEAPLSPRLNAFSINPAASMALPAPSALALWTPTLAAPMITPHIAAPSPAGVVLPAVLPAAAVPRLTPAAALAARAHSAPAKSDERSTKKLIDSLREHGANAAILSNLNGETGAGALERNFLSAAGLDARLSAPSAGDELPNVEPAKDPRPLLERILERVNLDDRGDAAEKKALMDSFKRMLATRTGRHYAEEFLAEGLTARIHFEDFPDSKLLLVEGRKRFYSAQAFTDWRPDGTIDIRLNRHFVDGDAEIMHDVLPSIIGHELLGHGLWYGRAAKDNLYLAYHYHELNETLARLVGWDIEYELNSRFETPGAWNFMADPAGYLLRLKMAQPYYSVTLSRQEMADPVGTFRGRLESARQAIANGHKNLTAQKTWPPVIDHFVAHHHIKEERFRMLREEMRDQERYHESEIANSEAIVASLLDLIGKLEAEPNRDSVQYLAQASAHAFFDRLSADTERLRAELERAANAKPPVADRAPPPRPADQITWDELAQMYRDDVAADAKRVIRHWH